MNEFMIFFSLNLSLILYTSGGTWWWRWLESIESLWSMSHVVGQPVWRWCFTTGTKFNILL